MNFDEEPQQEAALPGAEQAGESSIPGEQEPLRRFLIRSGERAFFLTPECIRWIEADDDFVRLHVDGNTHRVRSTLSAFYERLDQRQFLQINRSAIVNLDYVAELRLRNSSDYDVLLQDGTVLTFSRVYRESFQKLGGMFASLVESKERRRCG